MNRKVCRRQFLKGLGGCSVGLPFMPSLLPGKAFGQEAIIPQQKRFVAITSNHGGIFESAMYPNENLLTQTQNLYSGHDIRRGNLSSSIQGNDRVVSQILRAPSAKFSSDIVSKMNVLRGLDIPFYIAHHTGGHLGNYARNDGNGEDGQIIQSQYMPTIDQLMAWSSDFYQDLSTVTLRSVITGSNGRMSYNWSNPSARTGNIEAIEHRSDVFDIFEDIFKPQGESSEAFESTFVVDRVIENYRYLRQSNRRISSDDAQRLDDHMDRLFELQRRMQATAQSTALCRNFSLSDNISWDEYRSLADAYVDIIEAAFLCGSSAIGIMGIHEEFFATGYPDWHQSIAHRWNLDEPQLRLQEVNQQVFEQVFLELANRLNVEEAPGQTVLDNTLMVWSQESGEATHEARSLPVITCGGAGGFLSTGNYCDYRNLSPGGMVQAWGQDVGPSGLLYNQWLATALQAMGLPTSDWQNITHNASAGYGLAQISPDYAAVQADGVAANASQILPFLQG